MKKLKKQTVSWLRAIALIAALAAVMIYVVVSASSEAQAAESYSATREEAMQKRLDAFLALKFPIPVVTRMLWVTGEEPSERMAVTVKGISASAELWKVPWNEQNILVYLVSFPNGFRWIVNASEIVLVRSPFWVERIPPPVARAT